MIVGTKLPRSMEKANEEHWLLSNTSGATTERNDSRRPESWNGDPPIVFGMIAVQGLRGMHT